MNVFFVTAIAGLKIKSDLGQGVKIDDFTFLTNNKKKVQKEIHPNFRSIIGNMEYQGIFNSEALIYGITHCMVSRDFLMGITLEVKPILAPRYLRK